MSDDDDDDNCIKMKEFYKVLFISTNDCFFYLNESNLRKIKECNQMSSIAIKVDFGENFSQRMYSSLKKSCMRNIGNDEIGVSFHYASLQGLKEKDLILVSICIAPSLKTVYVRIEEELHRTIIKENFDHLQNDILNQVNTVSKGQIIPIHIYNNIIILLKIEKMDAIKPFGRLEKCSELIVLSPSDSCEIEKKSMNKSVNNNFSDERNVENKRNIYNEKSTKQVNWLSKKFNLSQRYDKKQKMKNSVENNLMMNFCKKLANFIFYPSESCLIIDESKVEQNASEVYQGSGLMRNYKVGPFFCVENEIPHEIKDKFLFTWDFPNTKPIFGPCSFKVFCKISKVEENSDQKIVMKSECVEASKNRDFFSYVVGFNEKGTNYFSMNLYCPDFIMENLKLKVGSVVRVEETKCTNEIIKYNSPEKSSTLIQAQKEEETFFFTEEIKKIYDSIIRTVVDNIKYEQKLNVLVIGSPGCGKTFLLNALSGYFNKKFLHCSRIDCKTLWRTKVEKLNELFSVKLAECCKLPPSVVLFDDLDSLFEEIDESVPYMSIYSRRIGDLLISTITKLQNVHKVIVVAAAKSMSKLDNISTSRGPIVFECIYEISELNLGDRNSILREFLSKKNFQNDASFIDEISEKTKGYNIQDLNDLVEIAALKCLVRSTDSTASENPDIRKSDFEEALSEKIPISLLGISLHKDTITWEDVGGMEEAKKTLTEMFAWPMRYPEIFRSCPLRHQCGVLLYGAPGTGKTLIAGAVSREFGLNFISIRGPEIFSKYVGASEEGIRNVFRRARQARPCILFFDEFDSLAPRRGVDNTGVNDRVVNQMLAELDGFEELTGVFVLAATSRPDLLDPALLRPGRIDKAVFCALPEKTERLKILKALSRRINLCENVDLEEIARRSEGFTGADLQAVLYSAQTFLLKETEKRDGKQRHDDLKLEQRHLLSGIAKTKPSISNEDRLKYKLIYDGFSASGTKGSNKSERYANGQLKLAFE